MVATSVVDRVMVALEMASQSVPEARQGWATPGEVDAFASEAGYKPYITWQKLDTLVSEGRAEKTPGEPHVKYYYRPFRGGAALGGGGSEAYPARPPYEPPPGQGPRGGQDDGKDQGGQDGGEYLALGAAGGAAGAAGGERRPERAD